MTKHASADVIVYGDIRGSLVFMPRGRAVELATIHAALWGAATWGELRARMPAGEYEDVLEMTGEDRISFDEFLQEERKTRLGLTSEEARAEYLALSTDLRDPEPDDPFRAGDVGPICDGDYPGWPQQEMLAWVPGEVQQQYGRRASSMLNGDLLDLPTSRTDEIVAALEAHGYRCVRDDSLIRRASGYGDDATTTPEIPR